MTTNACGLDCSRCPALARCGDRSNFCRLGACDDCAADPLMRMDTRSRVIEHLGGLGLGWHRPVAHPRLPQLPDHVPVLVQAYADQVDLPWIALHGGRVLGVTGRQVTAKHLRPIRDVYRLAPETRVALQLYVEDRVLEGLWAERRRLVPQIASMGFDLVLTPNFSVWRDRSRFEAITQQRRAAVLYHELVETGACAVPDVGWAVFEPDGRLWAEWINSQPDLEAVSIFCGGRKIHAELRAHRENVEDIAVFHRAVRTDVTFILGGVHAPARLADYRRAAPGRRLVVVNGMAYSLAQRRRLLTPSPRGIARSARECFLLNSAANDAAYRVALHPSGV
ncbi:MAG: hypothetical protein ACREOY_05120, partial [Candidatus Dormibacteraceae bacterium]